MKRLAYNPWLLRLRLVRVNIINSWQRETAYFGDSWGNILSTIIFTLTYIVFVEVIFANINSLAGYSRDEVLFLVFITQINFYLIYSWSFNNVDRMIVEVNDGSFDLLLVKPVPALFYTSIKDISTLTILRDGFPSLTFIALVINWSNISIEPLHLLLGIISLIAGQLALNGLLFLLGLPVFWLGQSREVLRLAYSLMSENLPYEGVIQPIRLGLTLLIPALVPASLTASIMLNKSNPWLGAGLAMLAALLLILAKQWLWKKGLQSYTSASS